ncbi:MAG: epimerase [Phycisphaerae bacterium]|nr:MAG: epimerase [Phycisphaerae bacterium]
MARSNILITGGSGFIGSHLATRFSELGHSIRIFDNFSTGLRENIAHLDGKVEVVEGDLVHLEECERACHDIDFIFHVAALPSVPVSIERPLDTHHSNITGTINLLMAAHTNKCKRVIYSGSSSCYGEIEVSPKHEGLRPQPISPYAAQKLSSEYYMSVFHHCYGLETLTTRYFNVFGPRQNPKSQYAAVIPAFVTSILNDEQPTIYGDGKQSRDFTYIENILHAYMLAIDVKKTSGQSVNVACGDNTDLLTIVEKINQCLGKNIQPKFEAPRAGDVRHSTADISAAKELLGFEPVVSVDEGLKHTVEYFAALVK